MMTKAFLTPDEIASLQKEEARSSKPQKRTGPQIEAIYSHGQNILVSASAGSGKTFVMVERILDKIQRGIGIDQLFISTFTVKTATELKERLQKRLQETIANSREDIEKSYLNDQLQALNQADIGTMDAFTQKLVSQYGYTLGIAPNFRILQDKSEQDILKNEIFSHLFEQYLSQDKRQLFKALVKNFSGNRKDSSAFRSVVYLCFHFSQSTDNPYKWLKEHFLVANNLYQDFADIPDQEVNLFLSVIGQTADSLRDLTDLEGYPQYTKAGKKSAKYLKHLEMIDKLNEWVTHFESLYGKAQLSQLAKDITALIPSGSEVTVAGHKYPIFKDLQRQLLAFRHLETVFHFQDDISQLLELLQAFVIDFSQQYLEAKKQENAYEFSDIAHFAIAILEENETIRKTYQERYHEVMVDEYQDNNHMQERLLELLSNGHNRFMVGDMKQSIYRFRQADPTIFGQKFKTYQDDPSQGKLILLTENFRSHSQVIDATNSVFSHLMDESLGEINYDKDQLLKAGSPSQQETYPQNRTQVLLYNTDQEEDLAETLETDGISANEVKIVLKEIIRLHQKENVPFSDITLLVSSRTRNDAIFQAFNDYGIPLVADGGQENYLKSVEVMVMLETLRSINNPLNDYALVALMRSPMFSFDEDQLARIALQESPSQHQEAFYEKLVNALEQKGAHPELIGSEMTAQLNAFVETLSSWRRFAKKRSLYDLIWKIYNDRFYFDFVATQAKADQAQANLYALALRANQFEASGYKGLSRFIRMIDRILETQNDLADVEVSPPKEAVNLMTIHKSKGLEFKYVFILNCDKRFAMNDLHSTIILNRQEGAGIKYLADVKDLLGEEVLPAVKVIMATLPYHLNKEALRLATLSEQMRLLYVAMTRAEKRLYLIGKASQKRYEELAFDHQEKGRLPFSLREGMMSFQEWLMAIATVFSKEELHYDLIFLQEKDLQAEAIGRLESSQKLDSDDLAHNRQTDDLARAIDMLEKVSELNQSYQAAIHLPTVRTPSQIKKYYEPIMDNEGVALIDKAYQAHDDFELPDFAKQNKISASQIGSSLHELMQRISVTEAVTEEAIQEALSLVGEDQEVKEKLDLQKVYQFFHETELGQLLQKHHDKLHREAPFAILRKDFASQEKYVVRGIIDGYLLFDDHIVLFDYKTDKFNNPLDLKDRYQEQLNLYAKALTQAYGINQVDKYLILMGSHQLEVLKLD
ncbi:helicase-exonuclease AddAB subunit AddA [Streptococcus ictaluri]|uniref:ATP-dependent helicase/nuclease subunit A n=1 Tax=Streptococcus ictaluri 707-05 TaxID=764299 RepID=G5K3X9_9STRE|nr:helicase-exonuclease AddAB subunit AddA [Streptococcus ictaluri]EHI69344.1 helicase-exonuclease AddAB, AddA subunit [Streptococcus ictaluri 707-05]